LHKFFSEIVPCLVVGQCWLGVMKSVRHTKYCVIRCWCGYLSGARCKWFAYGPADATATASSVALLLSSLV